MAPRKHSLSWMEKEQKAYRYSRTRASSGLSEIQAHIDMVKGTPSARPESTLKKMERERHGRPASGLRLTRCFDHSSVAGSSPWPVQALFLDPTADAFADATPFSTDVEPFGAESYPSPYAYPNRPMGSYTSSSLNPEPLPEHERPSKPRLPDGERRPGPARMPPSPYPHTESQKARQDRPPAPSLPDTAAAMDAFEADIQQMISFAKKRGDSPAVRTDPQEERTGGPSISQGRATHPHAIFDQMGQNLQYANSFDLGTMDVVKKFDAFDRELDRTRSQPDSAPVRIMSVMEPDDADIVADLAEIDMTLADMGHDPRPNAAPLTANTSAPATDNGNKSSRPGGESVIHDVPLVQAGEGLTVPAAAACMLVAAKHGLPHDPDRIRSGHGGWAPYVEALDQTDITRLIHGFGLTPVADQGVDQNGLETALRDHGPLMIWGTAEGPLLVVYGVRPSETTRFETIDPKTGERSAMTWPDLLGAVHGEHGQDRNPLTAYYA